MSRSAGNDAYAWTGSVNVDRGYAVNGLNQYTQSGPVALGYDARGNLTGSGSTTYGYDVRNRLIRNSQGQLLFRNPLNELGQVPGINLDHVNGHLATERWSGVNRRYVWGPGTDEPLVWYEGAGTGDKRWLVADERGSVVAVTDASGSAIAINTYDEYGVPGSGNAGRFQYTGQMWLPELGLYDYKARMYSPTLGRFMQTDPIGYGDGLNWYNYVGGDPVNNTDPSGLADCPAGTPPGTLCASYRITSPSPSPQGGGNGSGFILNPIPIVKGIICLFFGCGHKTKAAAPAPETQNEEVRSKPLVCKALGKSNYDTKKAWQIANTARKTETNGKTNWNNSYLRETENWLTAASDYYFVPFARTPQIYMHQYRKMLPFSGSTPFSQEALDAGLDGQAHNGDTPEQLKAWCNGK